MQLTVKKQRIFTRIQRRYGVSVQFLRTNIANIRYFIWHLMHLRTRLQRQAVRKRDAKKRQYVVICYSRLKRAVWVMKELKRIKTRKQSVKLWSRRIVGRLRALHGAQEYVEEWTPNDRNTAGSMAPDEVSKQMKEQLELLRSGKRACVPLVPREPIQESSVAREDTTSMVEVAEAEELILEEEHKTDCSDPLPCTPEKQIVTRDANEVFGNMQVLYNGTSKENGPRSQCTVEKIVDTSCDSIGRDRDSEGKDVAIAKMRCSGSFLDMLMSKVASSKSVGTKEITASVPVPELPSVEMNQEDGTDTSEEFLGFEEPLERLPGMLMTPIVPRGLRPAAENAAFISESLNEYMRENLIGMACGAASPGLDGVQVRRKYRESYHDGLVTPGCRPPLLEMPAVPESLQKLRTVAERRQYLQRFAKNHKLAIINNEATVYRELQRKLRNNNTMPKTVAQLQTAAANAQMPYTRGGWQAASFVTTESNRYYYQMLPLAEGDQEDCVRLPGVCGNNEEFFKQTHALLAPPPMYDYCPPGCADALAWRDLKPIKRPPGKAKLNKTPLSYVFKPCPLSQKPFQKPLDGDVAAMLTGGSMAVVRMPGVALEVWPKLGRPLPEVAKRYLQFLLPHHDISREWAEFSVSTLQTFKEATDAAVHGDRKSYTFAIPYMNDRSHMLVRRIVDRSEKLDESFELAQLVCSDDDSTNDVTQNSLVALLTDLNFRAHVDANSDAVLQTCADVVSDMINCVAISCSENSFIKDDPDNVYAVHHDAADPSAKTVECKAAPSVIPAAGSTAAPVVPLPAAKAQLKKQNRLFKELRRLNATVIDAGAKAEKASKPCLRPYCTLGCVCSSLSDNMPLRQHCGKSRCVVECVCKPNMGHSRIMRLETDGHSITTEDAFMLRRQATARLARMEKEFTSTIVLTDSETLLINESQYDKKRRCTKAPKRYDDFADTEDDPYARTTPTKQSSSSSALVAIEPGSLMGDNTSSSNTCFTDCTTELREPLYVAEDVLNELRHCSVVLTPLRDVRNMSLWCMVHELYRCFCGGRALEGKPLHVEKEETPAKNIALKVGPPAGADAAVLLAPASRARYSFDKVEKAVPSLKRSSAEAKSDRTANESARRFLPVDSADDEHDDEDGDDDSGDDDEFVLHQPVAKKRARIHSRRMSVAPASTKVATTTASSKKTGVASSASTIQAAEPPASTKAAATTTKAAPTEFTKPTGCAPVAIATPARLTPSDVLSDYYDKEPGNCRRCVTIPQRTYRHMNRKRSTKIREVAAREETEKKNLVLKEHILRSVYYHKHDSERRRQRQQQSPPATASEAETASSSKNHQAKPRRSLVKEERQLREQQQPVVISEGEENALEATSSKAAAAKRKANRKRAASTPFAVSTEKCDKLSKVLSPEAKQSAAPKTEHKKLAPLVLDATADVVDLTDNSTNAEEASDGQPPLKLPRIVSCYSMHKSASDNQTQATAATATTIAIAATTSGTSHMAPHSTNTADVGLGEMYESLGITLRERKKLIASMNNLVSKKMRDIETALNRESIMIPKPNEEILCIVRWGNFVDAYIDGYVHIWQVRMSENSFFVATITNLMPLIMGALGVLNLSAVPFAELPLLGLMLVQHCREPSTNKLAVLMQGTANYWMVRGFLLTDGMKACGRPTPASHPALTRKINELFAALRSPRPQDGTQRDPTESSQPNQTQSGLRQQDIAIMGRAGASNVASQPARSVSIPDALVSPSQSPYMSTSKEMAFAIVAQTSPTVMRTLTARFLDRMQTNIEFRKVFAHDIDELEAPETYITDHRWLVLDLHSDFSHIFVPDFRDLIPLDRIHKVMTFARDRRKIVKLQFHRNASYNAFVTPKSTHKIFFGPLSLNMRPPLIILLQSVDGQMMTREMYQRQHKIRPNVHQCTTAFWMLQIKGEIHFEHPADAVTGEVDSIQLPITVATDSGVGESTNTSALDDADDEDCMIVEPTPAQPPAQPPSSFSPAMSQTSQSPMQRINFTIQTHEASGLMQITPTPVRPCNEVPVPALAYPLSSAAVASVAQPLPSTLQQTGFLPLLTTPALSTVVPQLSHVGTLSAQNAMLAQQSHASSMSMLFQQLNKPVSASPSITVDAIAGTPVLPKSTLPRLPSKSCKRRRIIINGAQKKAVPPSVATSPLTTTEAAVKFKAANVSTIGSTTITKLNEETHCPNRIANNATPTTAGGVTVRSFASITVAKAPAMPASTATITMSLNSSPTVASNDTIVSIGPTSASSPTVANNDTIVSIAPTSVAAAVSTKVAQKSVKLRSLRVWPNSTLTAPGKGPMPAAQSHGIKFVNRFETQPSKVAGDAALPSTVTLATTTTATAVATTTVTTATLPSTKALPPMRRLLPKGTPTTEPTARLSLTPPAGSLNAKQKLTPTTVTTARGNTQFANRVLGNAVFAVRPIIRVRSATHPATKAACGVVKNSVAPVTPTTSSATMVTTAPEVSSSLSPQLNNNSNNKANTKSVITMKQAAARAALDSGTPKTGASKDELLPVQFGYICAQSPEMPRYAVRRQGTTYLIKVPTVGITQVKTLERVNHYLNSYLMKEQPFLAPKLPVSWIFMPHDVQRTTSHPSTPQPKVSKNEVTVRKSAVRKRSTAPNFKSIEHGPSAAQTLPTILNVRAAETMTSHRLSLAKTLAPASSAMSTDDTIVIED